MLNTANRMTVASQKITTYLVGQSVLVYVVIVALVWLLASYAGYRDVFSTSPTYVPNYRRQATEQATSITTYFK